ncbi:MAG: CopG family transcriptional regulator [Candidatus Atribacteria bacterium]|nr:CopG family transcriptional regulator [Candidatus Atribacteria bacterium]
MENQNITLSIPKEILIKVKHIAIEKNTSVSGLLRSVLEQIVNQEDEYNKAKERQFLTMKKGHELGIKGKVSWTRDELHERS